MHLYEVLRRPSITEKGTVLQSYGKYVFEVADKATKPQIKQAVEAAFKVKVTSVNIMTVRGKKKRMGRREVQEQSRKKAIVTLQPGDKIELFQGV
ncbi:MAG: 50S ribosomal protein L23 [Dehalococcoidales bacterium]|nr:50S ribosomal protein L23 [Dehalococcoidales bacterium]